MASDSKKDHQIFFVVNTPLPNEQAHGIQIMQMCDAFAGTGRSVTLLIPDDGIHTALDVRTFYKIPDTFVIEQVAILRLPFWKGGRLSFMLRWLSFSLTVLRYVQKKCVSGDILYVRGEMVLPLALLAPRCLRLCFETHIRPRRMGLYLKAMQRCELIVTVTKAWASELVSDFGLAEGKILVEPDAVDRAKFNPPCGMAEARRLLGLPQDKTIITYTGSDRVWKGLEVFKDAVAKLDSHYLAVFVGAIEKKYKGDSRFLYAGFQKHETIPLWLTAADFLVLTGSGSAPESERYTSPLKLFEYMAMQRPIIASDVPSFREILDDETAIFIPTEGADEIASCIKRINASAAQPRAQKAFALVVNYSWELRARRIVAQLG